MDSRWLGLKPYKEVVELQKIESEKLRAKPRPDVWGFESPSVLTLGLRSEMQLDLLSSSDEIQEFAEILLVDRGGQATFHSPGQLVIFPNVNLKNSQWGVRNFVEFLLLVTADSLQRLGLQAEVSTKFPGVYTPQGKIAFCGLRIDRGLVRHGLSVNIKNDLKLFQSIVPCGQSLSMDRLNHWVAEAEVKDFFQHWMKVFEEKWAEKDLNPRTSIDIGKTEFPSPPLG